MPKEIIQHPRLVEMTTRLPGDDGETVFIIEPQMAVRWSSALATDNFETTGEVRLSVADYANRTAGEIHATPWPPEPDKELITASLDRAAINRLITALRRARDAAYGKDA